MPRRRVLITEAQTAPLVERLHEGALDILLVALEADLDGNETEALLADPFLLAVPSGHRLASREVVTEKDLAGEQVLLLEDGHCLKRQALSVCYRAGACELGDFRASSLNTLVQMVAGGVGITLVPQIAVEVEAGPQRPLRVLPFRGQGPTRTIGLAWRPSTLRQDEFRMLGKTLRRGLASDTRQR